MEFKGQNRYSILGMTGLIMDDVILRELAEIDRTGLAELCNNRKIWDNLRDFIPFPYTESDADYFIGLCRVENPKTTFAIEYKGELAGTIGLIIQNDVYRLSAEIGYWIGEPFWGKGIATKAVKLMVGYGFRDLGLIRIFSGVFDYNKASQRVLEKAGFKLESIARKAVFKNGKIYNEYRYSIVKEDY